MPKDEPLKTTLISTTAPGTQQKGVDIFYEKAPQHQTVFADGVWAGLTPGLELQIVFFKNLSPVPEYVRQEITSDDSLGEELESAIKKGMIREYQTTVVLTRETTEAMMKLLQQILKKSEEIEKTPGIKTR